MIWHAIRIRRRSVNVCVPATSGYIPNSDSVGHMLIVVQFNYTIKIQHGLV